VEPTPEITLRQRIASLVTDYTFEDVVSALSVQAQDNARVAYTESLARQEMGGGVMTRSTLRTKTRRHRRSPSSHPRHPEDRQQTQLTSGEPQ
jgi:hypothetical protein